MKVDTIKAQAPAVMPAPRAEDGAFAAMLASGQAGELVVQSLLPGRGADGAPALERKLAELHKIKELEARLGQPVPLVLDVETQPGVHSLDVTHAQPAAAALESMLHSLRENNRDGRYDALLARYGA